MGVLRVVVHGGPSECRLQVGRAAGAAAGGSRAGGGGVVIAVGVGGLAAAVTAGGGVVGVVRAAVVHGGPSECRLQVAGPLGRLSAGEARS